MLLTLLIITILIYNLSVVAILPCACPTERKLSLQNPVIQGEDVQYLQERLRELGFYQGSLDGIFEQELLLAVKEFQLENQLEPSGVVEFETWSVLEEKNYPVASHNIEVPDGELSIVVDVNKRTLTVYVDEKEFKTYSVSVGKPSTKSPVGEWAIISKSKDWGGGFGTRWLGLNVPWGIYGIHGTNKPGSIGYAASHGCIRMHNRQVEELYSYIPLKTRVKIVGERLPINVNTVLEPGRTGLEVMQLQDNLKQYGFDPGFMDARYGPSTEDAIRELKAQFGFKVDGRADWDVLYILDLPG